MQICKTNNYIYVCTVWTYFIKHSENRDFEKHFNVDVYIREPTHLVKSSKRMRKYTSAKPYEIKDNVVFIGK